MKRDIYKKLIEWKGSHARKPLILKGARQVGKTYLLKEFGINEYADLAYFNFEEESRLVDFFNDNLSPKNIIKKLSIYREKNILPTQTLIIFDEIQSSPNAVNSLKYFNEEANEYHVIAAGSLLGITLNRIKSFPVGKVNFLNLYPMTFFEFLDAIDKSHLRIYLEEIINAMPIETIFHEELLEHLKYYYLIGGMPEAVSEYVTRREFDSVRKIHKEILASYVMDFSRHAEKADVIKIIKVWESIPAQLSKENKKYKFSMIEKNARFREYSSAIEWLSSAGLIHLSKSVSVPKTPLAGYVNDGFIKLYLLDVGLLCTISGLSQKTIIEGNELFAEFKGALAENFVAEEFVAKFDSGLFYWTSDSEAEVDFLVSSDEYIYPVEVKAGISKKKKSLLFYSEKFKSSILTRISLMNLKKDGKILNYPIYLACRFPEIK